MTKECVVCGATFILSRYGNGKTRNNRAKTCSQKCSKENHKQLAKKWKKKNRKKVNEYRRGWYQANKDTYYKKYHLKYKDRIYATRKKWRQNREKRLRKLIGEECCLCHSKEKLMFHEIYGREHETRKFNWRYHYIFEHTKDFATMCKACHKTFHIIIKYMDIEKLFSLLTLLYKAKIKGNSMGE